MASGASSSGMSSPPVLPSTESWEGTIAFANLGVPGIMVACDAWQTKHCTNLLSLLSGLMQDSSRRSRIIGLCLCEVGNLSDLLSDESRVKFDAMLRQLWKDLGREQPPTIFWSLDECVAAFDSSIDVKRIAPLTGMNIPGPAGKVVIGRASAGLKR